MINGVYNHNFELRIDEVYIGAKQYQCTKCGLIAVANYGKEYFRRFTVGYTYRGGYFKSYHKLISVGIKGVPKRKMPSLMFSAKKGNMAYGLNPWTGKKMAKLSCIYSNDEIIIKDIL